MGSWGIFVGRRRRRSSSYSRGVRAERTIANRLRNKGYVVRQSRGSRGPYDLYALKRGRKALVQVKSGSSPFSRADRTRLRAAARSKGAKAYLMRVKRGQIQSKIVY